MSLFSEIKRRHVIQVALVYAVVGWALIEIVATIEEPLGLPDWVDTLVIVLVIVGFPLALLLSWVFDLTPAGVVRTKDTEPAAEPPADRSPLRPTTRQEPLENSVAVLPLDNLSPNPDDAYFAAGIHEEILTQLAKIRDLNVIARTSVMQYAGAARPISDIANELRVGAVMEGSVRYAGEKVRVTADSFRTTRILRFWEKRHRATDSADGLTKPREYFNGSRRQPRRGGFLPSPGRWAISGSVTQKKRSVGSRKPPTTPSSMRAITPWYT